VVGRNTIELALLRARIEGRERQSSLILGRGFINSVAPDRGAERRTRDELPTDEGPITMHEEQYVRVLEELKVWSSSHPRREEPFLFFMGGSYTPLELYREVEDRTPFGRSFLRFLEVQSERFGERPWHAIARAVEANRSS
jgi:hypothetical protein